MFLVDTDSARKIELFSWQLMDVLLCNGLCHRNPVIMSRTLPGVAADPTLRAALYARGQ